MPYKKQKLPTLRQHLSSPPIFWLGSCCSSFQFFVLYYYVSLLPCCDVRYDFRIQTMFGSSLPLVFSRRDHVLFTQFVFVCIYWCPTHIVLCFCFVYLRLVYPALPVSLDCSFVIASQVFSSGYSLFCNTKPILSEINLRYNFPVSPFQAIFFFLSSFFVLLCYYLLIISIT